jgi:hypothetical protein
MKNFHCLLFLHVYNNDTDGVSEIKVGDIELRQ